MSDLHVVVLAAGKGTRMKSELPKVLHRLAGVPLLEHVLRTAAALSPSSISVVAGHRADMLHAAVAERPDVRVVLQEPQLGTAHALLQTEPLLGAAHGTIVVLSGDVPVLRSETLEHLIDRHERTAATATVLTALVGDPTGYGRILRTDSRLDGIVEERDASPSQREIAEINSGIYAFAVAPLFAALRTIASDNAGKEYYLTDLIGIYRARNLPVEGFRLDRDRAVEIRGINTRAELAEASVTVRRRKNEELMAAGVTLEDPATTYVGVDVTVGPDTVLHPGVILEGRTTIGAGCEIHSGVRIVDSVLGDGVTVNNFCVILGSRVASGAAIGPFAHLRPESELLEGARVGNFVELKKTVLGAGSKANHLAYLGDATIGDRVNVGAGTITCNYDGEQKHPTVIEDGAFIGSDTQLVAPVRVGRDAYVAAGSSITEDVPAGSLAIARGRQVNKPGWAENRRRKQAVSPAKD